MRLLASSRLRLPSPSTSAMFTPAVMLALQTCCVSVCAGCVQPPDATDTGSAAAVRLVTGAARPAPPLSPIDVDVDVLDEGFAVFALGGVALGGDAVFAADVSDAVRAVVVSAAVADVSDAADPATARIVVDNVSDGAGVAIVDRGDVDDATRSEQRVGRGFVAALRGQERQLAVAARGSFVFGVTPEAPRAPGTWRVGLSAAAVNIDDDGLPQRGAPVADALLTVVLDRRAISETELLHLPVQFYWVSALRDAPEARVRADAVIAALKATYAAADIDVDVDAGLDVDAGEVFPVVELRDELCDEGGLRTALAAVPHRIGVLDVVFVERLRCAVRGTVVDGIAGLAGAVPADAVGTSASGGVVIAGDVVFASDAAPDFAGVVVAHEVGHALGLFHTVERAGGGDALITDRLDDTTADPLASDNLMVAAPLTSTTLTPAQVAVLRKSPWLHQE